MSSRDATSAAKVFRKLITVDEALRELDGYLKSRQLIIEEVDLRHALARVLAEDILAVTDYPPFDRSEVDGFAVRSSDLEGVDEDNPVRLKVLGSVGVGEQPRYSVEPSTCVEVSTGAMVPRGADAVVPVEYTKKVGEYIYVYRSVAPGENLAYGGSDVLSGDIAALEGTLLGSAEIATLAGVGVSKVKVYKRTRIGLVSIGSELVEPGKYLKPGEVYDVNSYYLEAALRELGTEVVFYGVVEDSEDRLRDVLRKAISECDVVITSGGTSAGISDVTYRVVDELGKPGIIAHGLKIRPGKPTFIALIGDKLLFGLPGFPLSMMMIFNILVKPAIARILGLRGSYITYTEEAMLAERVVGYLGVDRLVPVILRRGPKGMLAFPVSYRSGSINTLQLADGFIRVQAGIPYIESGASVVVYRLNNRKIVDVLAIGSHDYLFADVLKALSREFTVKYVATGSLVGLDAVAKGVADVAGVHILDRDTGTYNEEAIRRLGYGGRVALVLGYAREVGLVTLKGNPKNVKSLRDLLRDDVIFINRSRYSGTRVLIDAVLQDLAVELGISFDELVNKIKGYHSEAKTHSGVAISILTGRADVGLTLRYVAQRYGLDFMPIAYERFDVAVSVNSLEMPGVKYLINYLRSSEFRQLTAKYPGYKVLNSTGELVFLK